MSSILSTISPLDLSKPSSTQSYLMDNTGYPFPIETQAIDLAEYAEDSSSTLSCPATSTSSSTSESLTPSPLSYIFSSKSHHNHHHLPTDQCFTLVHNVDSIYSSPTFRSQQKLKNSFTSHPPGSKEINSEESQDGEEERKGGEYDMAEETAVEMKSRIKFASTTPGDFVLPFQSLHEKKMNSAISN